jgi:hypothetical protein
MKTKVSLLVAVVILLSLVCWTIYGQKPNATKSWDYYMYMSSNNNWPQTQTKLNELGNQGWELVSVTEVGSTDGGRGGSVTLYLKRPK